jgi:hypothetical protein
MEIDWMKTGVSKAIGIAVYGEAEMRIFQPV